MMSEKKRKKHTSTEVKRRYNQKNYSQIIVSINKDTAEKFRKKCKDNGIPQAQVIKKAVIEFLNEN